MVWFQCEDCGENLKKPKLINHFRACQARKLSCIDCGVVFNQQTVQGHTQCVSEAEKYGPKNTGCSSKKTMKSLSKEANCDGMDISLGLSARAPWSCSLCNVKATSQETLMLHSQGKKHRSKVKASLFKQSNGNLGSNNVLGLKATISSVDRESDVEKCILNIPSNSRLSKRDAHNSKEENGFSVTAFTRPEDGRKKHEFADTDGHIESNYVFTSGDNKEQTEAQQKRRKIDMEQRPPFIVRREVEHSWNQTEASFSSMQTNVSEVKMSGCGQHVDGSSERKQKKHLVCKDAVKNWSSLVKWKKIIRRTLKNAPKGALKIKQLHSSLLPCVMETAQKFGLEVSKEAFLRELGKQIQSNAMFIIEGKKVRLAVKDAEK